MRQFQLPYCDNLLDYVERLRNLPYPLLFDSAAAPGQSSRFDVFCADPLAVLSISDGQATLTRNDHTEPLNEPPLQCLRQLLANLPRTSPPAPWPFAGGLAGLFGYDLGRRLQSLPERHRTEYQIPELVIGLYGWALMLDHHTRRAVLLGAAARSECYWQSLLERLQTASVLQHTEPFQLVSALRSNTTRRAYGESFRRVIDYIRAGDCYQVNLAQRFTGRYTGDPLLAYRQLRQRLASPFSAYFEGPDWAVLSVSPESFLRLDGDRVETSPIKGTSARGRNPQEDQQRRDALSRSSKDRAENLMIVDLLRNDLGRVCVPGSIKVERLWSVETFPNVHHLVSTVCGQLAHGRDAFDLLAACFPGGSITGAPKIRAMQIIDELEPHGRSIYCGSIGYIGCDGRMNCNIVIRTVLCDGDRIHCWGGGGLVADSIEEQEYQECLHKVGRILDTLAGAD